MTIPSWYQGSPESWDYTAEKCPGIYAKSKGLVTSRRDRLVIEPVPAEFTGYYVPFYNMGRVLPLGAYTGLWPNCRGSDWVINKPEGFGVGWRPTGY
jgi:hypothetical protein